MTVTHDFNTILSRFSLSASQLTMGGLTMSQIENIVGDNAFYAYDKHIIAQTIEQLKQQLPNQIKLHYAIKANPYLPLLHFIAPLVDGLDVASQGELMKAIQTTTPNHNISFAGPGKRDPELLSAITSGVIINVESPTELLRIEKLALTQHNIAQVALRVNPAFELKASGMKMTGGAKPFGIDSEKITKLIDYIDNSAMEFRGLHIFSGSQNLNPEALIEAHNKTFELANELLSQRIKQSKISINIGGGFGIPYFPGESELNISGICDNLNLLLNQYKKLCQNNEIVMELGRYLVASSGVYVSKVIDIKESRGTKYIVTNGGLHHHLSNSGNFGQVIRKNYPVAVANQLENTPTETVNIVGPLCTPLDIIAHKVKLPSIVIGDHIVVFQSGAYGATASPQQFLGHPKVNEILL
ncbi:pyridoxal-dependent decarboxylase, exosortase A system-associated [Psychrobium sp. 1_MG-2023]|uniref:pyridoxal-dependent decarboxylase, exosortase A system-associated n=1 Tax=Psychrobium sp. 1_MG-2023 TaxID=3062624 RepID=UPI000C335D51|nr:pyridoxal-dependent decarboxylase, exosortase A system-associated [Psychrobium sp. 1_MG-2023]MDP2561302.1 pyridoxal-dependent decarboxylase, exosortase A system-associated [Psychrobium sp. 1_MG-2023]PKF54118.1 pyridoxal-dependent decarboxylase, exosortase A system-associated [Alteromonadales bacterium alter-6D02]